MLDSTVAQLSAALAARKVSSVELTQGYLERIARINPALNAFITLDPDVSVAHARAADARIAAGGGGPLTGVPIGHKDLFLTEGWRTTCGSRMLANFVAPYESHVTAQLKAAGMVTMGKMNMDEYAMRGSATDMDEPIPLYTGDTDLLAWPGEYEQGPQMLIQHRLPLPCTVVALMPQLHTYDR